MTNLSPQNRDPIVTFDRVTYTHYGHTRPTLLDASLSIPRGSFTLLVGPSGSGKSTLCMLMNGIIPHLLGGELSGTVIVDGRYVSKAAVKDMAASVGMLFQDPEWMFATLHVEDEVAFGPENLRVPVPEIVRRVDEAVKFVEMEDLRQNLVWELSGGQIQKLGFAAVLAMETPLIVLDEPTANLDPATTHAVHQMIIRLRDAGKTVVLVTKDLDEFMAEADHVVLLAQEHVLAEGSPRDVLEAYGKQMLELGVWLPETTEIGLRLRAEGRWPAARIPITVEEAADALTHCAFLPLERDHHAASKVGDALIEANGIEYSYGGGRKALKGTSFEVRQGEIVAIVGQNGAGKSTLSKLLVGLLKPTRGKLSLFGKAARSWKVQDLANEVALVFQNPEHQFLCDTVQEELEYSLLAQGVDDPGEVKRRVDDMLTRLDIVDTAAKHPFSLSAGAKRRLGVATMLIGGRARLLIVDEPTYGQDKRLTEHLMELINNLRREGITILMITHDMRLVDAHIDRAMVMADGEKIFDGAPSELFQCPDILERASLRATALRRLVDALRLRGVALPEGLNTVEDFLGAMA